MSKLMSYSVPKLHDITFNNILRRIWKCSRLVDACVETTNRNNKLLTAGTIDDIVHIHSLTLQSIQDIIVSFEFFPKLWRANLASALETLDKEIYTWADELVSNLHQGSIENIEFCCKRIIITQEGLLDPRQTILNILYDSQFKITFTSTLLAYYCVDKRAVHDLSMKFIYKLMEVYANPNTKRDPTKTNNHIQYVRGVSEKVLKVDQFWLISWIRSQERASFTHSSLIQYVAANKVLVALKHFYAYMDKNEKISQLIEAFKYLIHLNFISPKSKRNMHNPDILFFFYENLQTDVWEEVLERHFTEIFFAFLASWRYRHLCVKMYENLSCSLDIQANKEILRSLLSVNNINVHDRYINSTIIMKIWNITPQEFREDPEVTFSIIPDIITTDNNLDFLSVILMTYSSEKQKEIIAYILLFFIARNKRNVISECLKTLATNGIHIQTDNLFNKDLLKSFFLMYYRDNDKFDHAYCPITNYVYETSEERNSFKEIIFNDKDFIVKFLSYLCMSCDECLAQEFIDWGFENERKQYKSEFRQRLLDEYMPIIYRNVITNVTLPQCSLRTLNDLCRFTQQQAFDYKLEVTRDPTVMHTILGNIIKCEKYDHLSRYKNVMTEEIFTNFIRSDDGIQIIYDKLILHLDNIEQHASLRLDIETLIDSFLSFKRYFLLSFYDLIEQLNNKLDEYGHPNLRAQELKLNDRYFFKQNELLLARQTVDAKYRIFRVILRTNFLTVSLNNRDEMTLSQLSMAMANDAGIHVAVVL